MARWDYERKFGKFRASVTDSAWFENLEEEILKSFENKVMDAKFSEIGESSNLGTQSELYRNHKRKVMSKWQKVYDAFKGYAKNVDDDEAVTWYHTICLQDYDLFCLNHVRPDNGLPMFPMPWQTRMSHYSDKYDFVFSLDSRKIGKSAWLQSQGMKWSVNSREKVRIFAPTEAQLFIRDDIHDNFNDNDFLFEEFVIGPSDEKRKQGRCTTEYIKLGRNGSDIEGQTLSQKSSKGKSKVGAKGTRFIIDEWGLVDDNVFNTVIFPMMADAHSRKKMVGFGTATYDVNPNMKEIWESYLKKDNVWTVMIPWTQGVREGAIPRFYMKEIFDRTNVRCPFGLNYGICGREWLGEDVRISEKTKKLVYPGEEDYDLAWECNECCYHSKTFAEEHWGKFVRDHTEYWPMQWIKASGNTDLEFWNGIPRGTVPVLVASVDFGRLLYPTQAVVGQVEGPRLIVRDHIEIPPLSESKATPSGDADPMLKKLWEFFAPYDRCIKKYYFDITGDKNGFLSTKLTQGKPGSFPGYKKSKIFRNDTAEKNGTWGIWNSGEYNAYMKGNLRDAFQAFMIEVPMREPFWSIYVWEFEHCQVEPTPNESYLKFAPPKNKRIDLLDTMAQLALAIDTRNTNRNTSFRAIGLGKKNIGGGYSVIY